MSVKGTLDGGPADVQPPAIPKGTCPYCGEHADTAQDEINHMETAHPEVVAERLAKAGIDPNNNPVIADITHREVRLIGRPHDINRLAEACRRAMRQVEEQGDLTAKYTVYVQAPRADEL